MKGHLNTDARARDRTQTRNRSATAPQDGKTDTELKLFIQINATGYGSFIAKKHGILVKKASLLQSRTKIKRIFWKIAFSHLSKQQSPPPPLPP